MTILNEKAWAKLNISLDAAERRADGYHDMTMVMQTVSLCDEVEIALNDTGRVLAKSNLSFVPGDARNLAVKAALCYLSAAGLEGQGMLITLDKKVPVGAGMGGGSSDAAAVLRALNRHYAALTLEALETLSAEVGSDVPFCVRGGTALATGRGEKLESLPDMPDCEFIICKPDFSISTPELFRKLDQSGTRCRPDTEGILAALQAGDLAQICRRMYNVFEDLDDRRLRTVREIKGKLLDFGALGAVMTGTGSAVFGVWQDRDAAENCAEELSREYRFCVVSRPTERLNIG